jgi:hypothetical protein
MKWWIAIVLPTCVALLMLCCVSCPGKGGAHKGSGEPSAEEQALELAQSPKPTDIGQARLDLEFTSAKPGSGSKPVNLVFTVADTAGNSAKLKLCDPKHPEPGSIKADGWSYTFTPRIDKGRESNAKLHQAFIRGYFCCDVRDPEGRKAGHFDVLNTGCLASKGQTEIPDVRIEPITLGARTLFIIWDAAAPDGTRMPLLGLEWQPAQYPGEYDVEASDGWTYSAHYPQGTLHAYQPRQLEGWPDQFRILAESAQQEKVAYHDQRVKELNAPPPVACGG